MTDHEELPTLPPDVLALLEAERDAPPMPHAARERIEARVEATVMAGALVAAVAQAESGRAFVWTSLFGQKLVIGLAAISIAVGGWAYRAHESSHDVGASTTAAAQRAAARSTQFGRAQAAMAPAAMAEAIAPAASAELDKPIARAADRTGAQTVTPAPASAVASTHDDALGQERAILEEARGAMRLGDTARAETALARHARAFPSGRLAEERESLWVVALARAGRREEAKRRADFFRARWPVSIYGAAVDAAIDPGGNKP
jgi:hypothetical protein